MWVKLGNFSFLIIDEIFMVGVDYLYIVYRCLLGWVFWWDISFSSRWFFLVVISCLKISVWYSFWFYCINVWFIMEEEF